MKFNPCLFIGSGFTYTITGVSGDYKVKVLGRKVGVFSTLDDCHKRIMKSWRIYNKA